MGRRPLNLQQFIDIVIGRHRRMVVGGRPERNEHIPCCVEWRKINDADDAEFVDSV